MLILLKMTRWIYNTFAGAMTPTQIAYGLCLGLFLVMMPWGLQSAFVLSLALVTRASLGLFSLTAAVVKPLMLLGGDVLAWRLGHSALEAESLRSFWSAVLNLPVVALVRFERYHVLGGFLLALIAAAILFFPIRQGVVYFRTQVQPRADQYRIIRWWRGFWLTKALSYVFVGGGDPQS